MKLSREDLRDLLEEKHDQYNRPDFIESDPISIPHRFSNKEDIEISAFLTATIAWGKRIMIMNNANKLVQWMDDAPHDFLLNAQPHDFEVFRNFVHRTFNGEDCVYFMQRLSSLYKQNGGLEAAFSRTANTASDTAPIISDFRRQFFDAEFPQRTGKHVSDPARGSAAKRLNMFLRWMVRNDKRGVDFGIWKQITPAQLSMPLDVHTGNVGRKLKLLTRKQNDWKAVAELDANLRTFDANDPVKYDFALFGLGVFEGF